MKYGFKTFKMVVENHAFWVVESTDLKGCAVQADSLDEALSLYEKVEEEWLETAKKYNIPIPVQSTVNAADAVYSGKLSLRIAKSLHKEAAELAKEDNISINTFISNAIASSVAEKKADKRAAEEVIKASISRSKSLYMPWKGDKKQLKLGELNYGRA